LPAFCGGAAMGGKLIQPIAGVARSIPSMDASTGSMARSRKAGLLAGSALAGGTLRLAFLTGLSVALGMSLAPRPAAAQAACGISGLPTEGAEPQTSGGATATGADAFACGQNAIA